jgi:carbamoyltransferase
MEVGKVRVLGVNKGSTVYGKRLRHGGAALAVDGRIVALSEERVSGDKYAGGFAAALTALLRAEELSLERHVDLIGVSSCCEDLGSALIGHELQDDRRLVPINHHLSHGALAFYGSGFERAIVLVADGGGNVLTTQDVDQSEWWKLPREQLSCFVADRRSGLELIDRDFDRPYHAGLGELYRAFTYFLGWHSSVYGSRTMALAGHGTRNAVAAPLLHFEGGRLTSLVRNDPGHPIDMVFELGHVLDVDFGEPRSPDGTILQVHKDVAAFLQAGIEEALLLKLRHLKCELGLDQLCFAGGLALNVIANARLLEVFPDGVYVPSAPADDGQCLGNVYALIGAQSRGVTPHMRKSSDAFLGPANNVSSRALASALMDHDVQSYVVFETSDSTRLIADVLEAGSPVCIFQGRSEFGPRALGARSILADPRRTDAVSRLNALKGREWFMPFAPAVLAGRMGEWFHPEPDSPFMSFAVRATDRTLDELPAVVNLDGTARVQTVDSQDSTPLLAILEAFEARTGIPVLLNTSFNLGGKPIVESVDQAVESFKEMPINVLGIGRFVVVKSLSPDLKDLPVTSTATRFDMQVYRAAGQEPVSINESTAARTVRRLQALTESVVFVRTELPLYEEYLEWLRRGRKVTTIRFRKGAVEVPYNARLPLFKTEDFGPGDRSEPTEFVEVSALRYHRFGELTQEHATRDGFSSRDSMREALTKIYEDLADGDWVTVYDINLVQPHEV